MIRYFFDAVNTRVIIIYILFKVMLFIFFVLFYFPNTGNIFPFPIQVKYFLELYIKRRRGNKHFDVHL